MRRLLHVRETNLLFLAIFGSLFVVHPAAAQPKPKLPQIQTKIFERGGGTGKIDLRSSKAEGGPASWYLAGGELTVGDATFGMMSLLGVLEDGGGARPTKTEDEAILFQVVGKAVSGKPRPAPGPVGYGYILRSGLDRGVVEGEFTVSRDPGRGVYIFSGRGSASDGGSGGGGGTTGGSEDDLELLVVRFKELRVDEAEAHLRRAGFTDITVQRMAAVFGKEGKFVALDKRKVAASPANPRGLAITLFYYHEADRPGVRIVWTYAGGRFEKDGENWIERDTSGRIIYRFIEMQRGPEYVEIYDASRTLSLRMFSTHSIWRRDGMPDWANLYAGRWER